jgi:hypothetical protein
MRAHAASREREREREREETKTGKLLEVWAPTAAGAGPTKKNVSAKSGRGGTDAQRLVEAAASGSRCGARARSVELDEEAAGGMGALGRASVCVCVCVCVCVHVCEWREGGGSAPTPAQPTSLQYDWVKIRVRVERA